MFESVPCTPYILSVNAGTRRATLKKPYDFVRIASRSDLLSGAGCGNRIERHSLATMETDSFKTYMIRNIINKMY